MDFNQLWLEYEELILVVATVIVTLVARHILPGLWNVVIGLAGKLRAGLGRRLSTAEFERRYLEQLCEEQRFLKVRGIRTRSPVAVELEKVYVSLRLSRPSRDRPDVGAGLGPMLEEKLSEGVRAERVDRLDVEVRVEEAERLSVGEALQRCPQRLVILGGPGTGKTTLLSYLALKFARRQAKEELGLDEKRLPVLIALRELPRSGLSLTADNLPSLCTGPELAKQCPDGYFRDRLKRDNCIVLLDGMDEVTTEDERRRVAEQIDEFVSTYPDNRFVVTSRRAGYSGVALTGFTQLDICDFSDEDVEAFARYWCLAVELAVRGVERGISEEVARRNAELEAGKLIAAIRASDRVRRLTVNPLLLTIVAMVHRYRATLPNRRVELYDECTQVLLGYWDKAKGIFGQLDWARKRRVLERLAFWMHNQGLREAERPRAERVIAEALPSVGEEDTQAGEFLTHVRERSGLLMERGLGIYGFSHLTFQEYLTASYLIDRGKDGEEELLKHVYDPWWLEVTLLYAGMRDASPLVTAILEQREDLFKTNLFLAAYCLVDVVNIDPRLEDEVLSRLTREFRGGEFQGLRERASEALVRLASSRSAPRVVETLLDVLWDKLASVRASAAEALGRLGHMELRIVEALVDRLQDEDPGVRRSAAEALGRLAPTEPRVVEALLDRLGDRDGAAGWCAAEALARLGEREPSVVEALVDRLAHKDSRVRECTADALGHLGDTQVRVVEALLDRLGDEDWAVSTSAARALVRLGETEPTILEALLDRLHDEDPRVRMSTAEALAYIEATEPRVVEALLDRLHDEDPRVRGNAAFVLAWIGQLSQGVVEALLDRLEDEDPRERRRSTAALGFIEETEPRVVEALLDRLEDEDPGVRGNAAVALAGLTQTEPRVVEALLDRLGDEHWGVYTNTAFSLARLGETEPRVVEAVLDRLDDDDPRVRTNAALALGLIGQMDSRVLEVVLDGLGDEDPGVRTNAARTLFNSFEQFEQISSDHVPILTALLENSAELEKGFGIGKEVRDVAWLLLERHSVQTGARIYRDDEGAVVQP